MATSKYDTEIDLSVDNAHTRVIRLVGDRKRILDVGCATGYSSAVLSKLAGTIVALEEDRKLAEIARDTLAAISAQNVAVEEDFPMSPDPWRCQNCNFLRVCPEGQSLSVLDDAAARARRSA